MPIIHKILRENAGRFIKIKVAPRHEDTKCATDFMIVIDNGSIAVRVRSTDCIFRDFTVRSRTRCNLKTEIHKLRDGMADWYLYLWHKSNNSYDWVFLDIDKIRKSGLLDKSYDEIPNGDGTWFIAIPLSDLRIHGCVINESIKLLDTG